MSDRGSTDSYSQYLVARAPVPFKPPYVTNKSWATLHYKSERALSFMSLLQKLQYMFQLCAEQGEIVSRATAVQHPTTGDTIILIINQGLWFGDNLEMSHSLINPNQIRAFGHHVQENPYNDQLMAINIDEENIIPLQSSGTTIFFDSYKPAGKNTKMMKWI